MGGRCRDGGKWAVSSTMLGSEQKKLRKKKVS